MKHDMSEMDMERFLRRSLSDGAQAIAVPDIWSGVRDRMGQRDRWNRLQAVTPDVNFRWLAPAGTALLLLVAVVTMIILLNNAPDSSDSQSEVASNPETDGPPTLSLDLGGHSFSDEEIFINALRSLESAAPFKVESESTIPQNSVGGFINITWPAYSSDSLFWQTFPNANRAGGVFPNADAAGSEGRVPENFGWGEDFEDHNCERFATGTVCDRVWLKSGETLGYSASFWGIHQGAGIFVSPELYRTRRQMTIDSELKKALDERATTSTDLSFYESIYEFRQEDGLFYAVDGRKWSSSPFAEVVEGEPSSGSLYAFLMTYLTHTHLYGFLEFEATNIVDAANFSDIERITPENDVDGEGLIHYRAGISDFLGDDGIWQMWISPEDGLPRRIEIEAFRPSETVGQVPNVSRATLTFSQFGEDLNIYGDLLLFDIP